MDIEQLKKRIKQSKKSADRLEWELDEAKAEMEKYGIKSLDAAETRLAELEKEINDAEDNAEKAYEKAESLLSEYERETQ